MEPKSQFDQLSCQEIFAMLSEYLDRELSPELCEKLSSHIQDCPPCVEFVNSLRQSIELCGEFKAGQAPPLPEDVRATLRNTYNNLRQSL